ncbi:hypothetical protein CGSMWGv00703C2mash_01104, partial [Gardnerella pickettii 00703C2mash]
YDFSTFFTILLRDHPRVCGKDSKDELAAGDYEGSPPRMRERRKAR